MCHFQWRVLRSFVVQCVSNFVVVLLFALLQLTLALMRKKKIYIDVSTFGVLTKKRKIYCYNYFWNVGGKKEKYCYNFVWKVIVDQLKRTKHH